MAKNTKKILNQVQDDDKKNTVRRHPELDSGSKTKKAAAKKAPAKKAAAINSTGQKTREQLSQLDLYDGDGAVLIEGIECGEDWNYD